MTMKAKQELKQVILTYMEIDGAEAAEVEVVGKLKPSEALYLLNVAIYKICNLSSHEVEKKND